MPVLYNDQVDDQLSWDADDTYIGGQVSFARARQVQPGQAKEITNHTISIDGELRSRHGIASLGGDGTVGSAAAIIQALIYFDRVADESLVAITQGNAFKWNGSAWVSYFTAGISDTSARVDLVQLTDSLYWGDGGAAGIRKWNGTTVSTIASSPIATIVELHTNRLVAAGITSVPDGVYFSDILDADTWGLTTGAIRVGGGDGDPVVALKSWLDTQLLVFRRSSVYIVNANPISSIANMEVKKISGSVGCVARHSVCQVGQDIWFLSRTGIQSVQRQIATSESMIQVPVSQPVQDLIYNIRWDQAHKSYAICYNNYYMLAIPVDSNEPDTVLVFHYLGGGWTIFTGWTPSCFYTQPYSGGNRLLIGEQGGDVCEWRDYIAENADEDTDFQDKGQSIDTTLVTRSFIFNDAISNKSAFYAELDVFQSDVTFSIYAILDDDDPILVRTYTLDVASVTLPVTLPFTLVDSGRWKTKRFPLWQLPSPFREMQLKITSIDGRFIMRRLVVSAYMDTIETKEQ